LTPAALIIALCPIRTQALPLYLANLEPSFDKSLVASNCLIHIHSQEVFSQSVGPMMCVSKVRHFNSGNASKSHLFDK
jgi:hypothetical protein